MSGLFEYETCLASRKQVLGEVHFLYGDFHSRIHLAAYIREDLQEGQVLGTDIVTSHHTDTAEYTNIS